MDEDDNGKLRLERVKVLNYFCINHGDQRFFFNLKSSYSSLLAVSASFEYLCYGSTTIINILLLSVRGASLYVRI